MMIDPIYNDTAEQPLIRQLQLHPSLYCLMATDEQAALMINVIADAIEYEGLSGTTVDWLRTQAGETKWQCVEEWLESYLPELAISLLPNK
jgi:hypothetical protein